uniref:Uncharacterized protein n=1 Tax=Latimeria chalumnae TaxID=7897 RepID=H3ACS9_LATCH
MSDHFVISDFTGERMSPIRAHTMKDFENQITELKKENFNLKLRIYFLEERMQQKYDDASEDIFKTNIELKVEIESLKHELQEKQGLLIKASKAVESLAGNNTAEIQRVKQEAQQEIQQIKKLLGDKIHCLEEDVKSAQAQCETIAAIAEQEKVRNMDLEQKLVACNKPNQKELTFPPEFTKRWEEQSRVIEQLNLVLKSKETLIDQLQQGKAHGASNSKWPLEEKIEEMTKALGVKENEAETKKTKKKKQEVSGFPVAVLGQEKLQQADVMNKGLQGKLKESECELATEKQNGLKRDKTIQGLTLALKSKDKEIEDLFHEIEDRDCALAKAREAIHKAQINKFQGVEEHTSLLMEKESELAELRAEHSAKLRENQKLQRALGRKDQEFNDLQQEKEQLEKEMDEVQQQKSSGDKVDYCFERCCEQFKKALNKLRFPLSVWAGEKHEYMELAKEAQQGEGQSSDRKDAMLANLRECLKEKDRELKSLESLITILLEVVYRYHNVAIYVQAINEKFSAVDKIENEVRQLRLALREKEREVERLNNLLSSNEETINELEGSVKEKDTELHQLLNTCKNLQRVKQELEESKALLLHEKDGVVSQLHEALANKSKDLEEIRSILLSQKQSDIKDVAEQLHQQLKLKERLLEEAWAEKERLHTEHEKEVEELFKTIQRKDQFLKLTSLPLEKAMEERLNKKIEDLKRQLSAKEDELTKMLIESGQEKDQCFAKLKDQGFIYINTAEENQQRTVDEEIVVKTMPSSKSLVNLKKELAQRTEELNKALKKESEMGIEVMRLKSLLSRLEEELQAQAAHIESLSKTLQVKDEIIQDLQATLRKYLDGREMECLIQNLRENLQSPTVPKRKHTVIGGDCKKPTLPSDEEKVLEYEELKRALKAEQQLYSSLIRAVKDPDSMNCLQNLQMELTAVQLLRQQLEEEIRANQGLRKDLEETIEMAKKKEGKDSNMQFSFKINEEALHHRHHHLVRLQLKFSTMLYRTLTYSFLTPSSFGGKSPLQSGVKNELKNTEKFPSETVVDQQKIEEGILLKSLMEETGMSSVLELRNELLQLQAKVGVLHREQVDTLGKESSEDEREGKDEMDLKQMVIRLRVKLRNSRMINKLLKQQVELNSSVDGESTFNPDLIVKMAKEIERLKEEVVDMERKIKEAEDKVEENTAIRKASIPRSTEAGMRSRLPVPTRKTRSVGNMRSVPSAQNSDTDFQEQIRQLRRTLKDYKFQNELLQRKLCAAEVTVASQQENVDKCRAQLQADSSLEQDDKEVQVDLQDLGYETCGKSENEVDRDESSSPGCLPILSLEELLLTENLATNSSTSYPSSASLVSSKISLKNLEIFDDCELTDDPRELKQQITELRIQIEKYQKELQHLQKKNSLSALISSNSQWRRCPQRSKFWIPIKRSSSSQTVDLEDQGKRNVHSSALSKQERQELERLKQQILQLEPELEKNGIKENNLIYSFVVCFNLTRYDSLVQSQARELSHFRQQIKESRSLCILHRKHLQEVTKAFEELLQASDVDYYVGESFREQLDQSVQLLEKLESKLDNGDVSSDSEDGELFELAQKLTKELQEKNKTIHHLQQQLRNQSLAPSICHTSYESEASDRYSLESPEAEQDKQEEGHGGWRDFQRNSSAGNLNSENGHHIFFFSVLSDPLTLDFEKEQTTALCSPRHLEVALDQPNGSHVDETEPGIIIPSSGKLPLPENESETRQEPPEVLHTNKKLNEANNATPFVLNQSTAELQRENSALREQLKISEQLNETLRVELNLHQSIMTEGQEGCVDRSTLSPDRHDSSCSRNREHGIATERSNESKGINTGTKLFSLTTKNEFIDFLAEHLQEIRILRQRLEDSIRTNDRLRKQLEQRLSESERDLGKTSTNIFIHGSEEHTHRNTEIHFLREQNQDLKEQLTRSSRDKQKENEKLKESLAKKCCTVERLRIECEHNKRENGHLQKKVGDGQEENRRLKNELHYSRDEINRLQRELSLQQQELTESQQLLQSLRLELKVYEQLNETSARKSGPTKEPTLKISTGLQSPVDMSELVAEIRSLRVQLERSIQTNNALRQKLEEQLLKARDKLDGATSTININYLLTGEQRRSTGRNSNDVSSIKKILTFMNMKNLVFTNFPTPPKSGNSPPIISAAGGLISSFSADSASHTPSRLVPGHRMWADRNGHHVLGLIEDYNALRKQISEGRILVRGIMHVVISACIFSFLEKKKKTTPVPEQSSLKKFFSSVNTMQQMLEEVSRLLKLLWKVSLPSVVCSDTTQHNQDEITKNELARLQKKISEQEKLLHGTVKRLRTTNQLKEGMEKIIIDQCLSATNEML